VLCRNAPETKDNDFTWKDFQDRNNSELVAIFGNFVNRAFVLMHKLCGGKVPVLHSDILDDADRALINDIKEAKEKVEQSIENYRFRDALFEVIDLARKGNKYMQDKEPWKKASVMEKTPDLTADDKKKLQQQIDNCLHLCLQLTANLAILVNPFLPNTAKKLCHMMKVVEKMLDWSNGGSIKLLSVGYSLRAPELLFRKIEDEEITAQIEKLKSGLVKTEQTNEQAAGGSAANITASASATSEEVKNVKDTIQYDDFAKLDLKVGTIKNAVKVEKADKLLKLEVDLGFEVRTIVSGIAMHFTPEEIVGKQVVVVANLAPRKMRGIESNGMILMAEDKSGKLHFVAPPELIDNGAGVS